jgi:hypothetical protein
VCFLSFVPLVRLGTSHGNLLQLFRGTHRLIFRVLLCDNNNDNKKNKKRVRVLFTLCFYDFVALASFFFRIELSFFLFCCPDSSFECVCACVCVTGAFSAP